MATAPANSSLPTSRMPQSRSAQSALAGLVLITGLFATYRLYFPSSAAHPTEDGAPRRQIDLNRADRQELLQIPGLGPSNADAILAYRAERGPFETLDDLTHVHGMGPKTTEKVKPWLNLSPSGGEPLERLERKPVVIPSAAPAPGKAGKISATEAKIDVNAAAEADFLRLPGIGPTLAARIVLYRANTAFASLDDLRKVKGIGVKTLDAIRPFLVVNPK